MKLRYPTEKDLMAALRARGSRRLVTAARAKQHSAGGSKQHRWPVFPACFPRPL